MKKKRKKKYKHIIAIIVYPIQQTNINIHAKLQSMLKINNLHGTRAADIQFVALFDCLCGCRRHTRKRMVNGEVRLGAGDDFITTLFYYYLLFCFFQNILLSEMLHRN